MNKFQLLFILLIPVACNEENDPLAKDKIAEEGCAIKQINLNAEWDPDVFSEQERFYTLDADNKPVSSVTIFKQDIGNQHNTTKVDYFYNADNRLVFSCINQRT